ncbi:autotransporter outer membrane beta-barrel domain-containing protein [Stenotrophomonas sp. GD03777]|uniref:autotransporter outer membrane beta-barrel domain-containing protein n=1 Tax=Stenotrophomonas sp. GD03777 TaxID=2975380 RepID=UPI00244B9495|nr:autotransporter outer membrane beta-barrel domain-containing protein [Stenotrophomonas sp. GD03777]MDH1660366.1 autotransporter outer membrane beta-barrel domain-containing protein [Stenotrophomonas sp. GD03777]
MNIAYRIVWSAARAAWVVVSELGSRSHRSTRRLCDINDVVSSRRRDGLLGALSLSIAISASLYVMPASAACVVDANNSFTASGGDLCDNPAATFSFARARDVGTVSRFNGDLRLLIGSPISEGALSANSGAQVILNGALSVDPVNGVSGYSAVYAQHSDSSIVFNGNAPVNLNVGLGQISAGAASNFGGLIDFGVRPVVIDMQAGAGAGSGSAGIAVERGIGGTILSSGSLSITTSGAMAVYAGGGLIRLNELLVDIPSYNGNDNPVAVWAEATAGAISPVVSWNTAQLNTQYTGIYAGTGATVEGAVSTNIQTTLGDPSGGPKKRGYGVYAFGDSRVSLNGASRISTLAGAASAVVADGQSSGSTPSVGLENTNVRTAGDAAHGLFAIGSGASIRSATTGAISDVATQGAGSDAVRAESGAQIALARDTLLTTSGDNASGVHVVGASAVGVGAAPILGGSATVNLSGGRIKTSGAGAHAISVETQASPGAIGTTVNLIGGTLQTSGANASAVDVQSGAGTVSVSSSSAITAGNIGINVNAPNVAGPVAVSNLVGGTINATQQAIRVAANSGTVTIANDGSLTSTAGSAIDVSNALGTNIINSSGDITAATSAIIGQGGVERVSLDGGTVKGDIRLGAGNDQLDIRGGTLLGAVEMGDGDDLVRVVGSTANVTGVSRFDGGVNGGSDRLQFSAANYTLTDSSRIANFENVDLTNGAVLTLNAALLLGDGGSEVGTLSLADTSVLAVRMPGAFQLNSTLFSNSGEGRIEVDTGGQAFSFTANTGSGFKGVAALGNTRFDLSGVNTSALTNATLEVANGSRTVVGDGVQAIGGLRFSGGEMVFNAKVPAQATATSIVQTSGVLDTSGTGTVTVTVPDNVAGFPNPAVAPDVALLSQDDGNIGVQLVRAGGAVVGSAGGLDLRDQNGNLIAAAGQAVERQVAISEAGSKVAEGTYGYRLTTGDLADGLYVNYGLKRLDVLAGMQVTLQAAQGAVGNARDLSAQVTGAGGVRIDTAGAVSLSNANNTYAGATDVLAGTLVMGADSALGNSSALNLASGTAANMNGRRQTVGTLSTAAGSRVDLASGHLTLSNGGQTAAGTLIGGGQLTVTGGTLSVSGANADLSASVAIAGGAKVVANHVAGIGSGAVVLDGELRLMGAAGALNNTLSGGGSLQVVDASQIILGGANGAFAGHVGIERAASVTVARAVHLGQASVDIGGTLVLDTVEDSWRMKNELSGQGELIKRDSGSVSILDGGRSFTGMTLVQGGVLSVGDEQSSGQLGGGVAVAAAGTLSGSGSIAGSVVNNGLISALNALPGKSTDPASKLTMGRLTNNAVVQLAGAAAGNSLMINGGYVGNNALMVLNTFKGGDNSPTDHVTLNGGEATGKTALRILHAGGDGAKTRTGIELIQARNGAKTATSAFYLDPGSDGYRQGKGTLAAGAYDYTLRRGGNRGIADSWYLTSSSTTSGIRPEPIAYLGNLAALGLLRQSWHDRIGEARWNVDGDHDQAVWARVVSNTESKLAVTGDNSLVQDSSSVRSEQSMLQVGATLWQSAASHWQSGAMLGAGRAVSNGANALGLSATGRVNARLAGAYLSWMQNPGDVEGGYMDSWLQYIDLKNRVQSTAGLGQERYDSSAWARSIELGYSIRLRPGARSALYLQPQVQATYVDYEADDYVESNGTRVHDASAGGLETRIGARVFGHATNTRFNRVQPFLEVNWLRSHHDTSISFDGDVVRKHLPRDRYEVKAGAELELGSSWSGWGSAGLQKGRGGYRDVMGQMGLKFQF